MLEEQRIIILLHDPDFKKLTGRAIKPSQLDLKFIKENIEMDGEPITTLQEALETVNGKAGMFI